MLFSRIDSDVGFCDPCGKMTQKLDISMKITSLFAFKMCVFVSCMLYVYVWLLLKSLLHGMGISWKHLWFLSILSLGTSLIDPQATPTVLSVDTTTWATIVCFQTEVVVTCFIIVVLCQLENKLSWPDGSVLQKMCSSKIASLTRTQQVIFMNCVQVIHIWCSKEVCHLYGLPSSLFIL